MYNDVTKFIVLLPIIIFSLRASYRLFYHLGFIKKDGKTSVACLIILSFVMMGLFIYVIWKVYILHKDELYKLIVGDIKCLVGCMLFSLSIGYFIPKTKSSDDIIAVFVTLITSLFFISDGLSDMESILDVLKLGKKNYNNNDIFKKNICIITKLARLKFVLSFVSFTASISAIIYLTYVSFINMINNTDTTSIAIATADFIILLCTISLSIFPVIDILLKLIYHYSNKKITSKEDIVQSKESILNTLKLEYKRKFYIFARIVFIVLTLLVAFPYPKVNYFLLFVQIFVIILEVAEFKIIVSRINKYLEKIFT